jgi:HemY protein
MKLLLATLIVLVAAVVFALYAQQDPGYVIINFRDWRIETSLVLLIAAALLGFFILYYLIRFIIKTRRIPKSLSNWKKQRRMRKARKAMSQGLMALAEGNWTSAEKSLVKYVNISDTPVLNYLNAARAAQKLGATERRDYYLRKANEVMPKANVAIALTQAELQVNQGQMEQALATLTSLQNSAPRNTNVQKLLLRLYVELHDWERLLELLPKLTRQHLISQDQYQRLEQNAYTELVKRAAADSDLRYLNATWQRVPRHLKQDESLLRTYVNELVRLGAVSDAENILYQSLNKKWDDSLVYLYGTINLGDLSRQLSRAEGWLKKHQNDPTLLLTAGRLCVRYNLWGKARQYLEASAAAGMHPETYKELGNLLEHMGETDQAREYYRKGLAMTVGTRTAISPPIDKTPPEKVLPSPL